MSSLGVLADHHWFVRRSASTTYLCWLCHSSSLDKEDYFVRFFVVAFLPATMCMLSLSLPIPHGMHLVVPTHPYFFWVVCYPSRTFFPKEPEQESQNRFSPLFIAGPYFLTSNLGPTTPCIGWVQAGDVWALCVLYFCVCLKLARCSCVCCGLEACLLILSPILDFL